VPEGDTIHRTAAALRASVLGKPVTVFYAPRLTGITPAVGAVIERVEARGKHLEIGFDDGVVLHTHMRMSGSWHLYRQGEQWRKPARQARVVIEVPGWQAVCFNAPVVETYRNVELTPHPALGGLGPDLCRADADIGEGVRRMGRLCEAETTVAEALLDQRVVAGVGNVYKSEVLWACELHPFTPVGALDEGQRRVLLQTAARLLRANLDRPTRVTVPGSPDGVAVYGRFGKPCLRCGTPIEVRKHGEQARVTYWCPGCQYFLPLPEPEEGTAPPPDERRRPRGWFGRRRSGAAGPPVDDAGTALPEGSEDDSDPMRVVTALDPLLDPLGETPVPGHPELPVDRHPAAREFLSRRPLVVEPSYLDPLLSRRPTPTH
jgi:endonuclease-8